ncbi:hypothetical protein HYPSUDRAFT_48364 [Hypholoma sublateritium FD-334 SS-4]|uniref:Uncharacterized protein n=1 Tax=Hypholoma sublateritium (strain FD-334 SS-4) TaxID=945553 RepID=A0A0D2LX35_HYPSF|nr:hypothetical protein HYPSUDRAFT_48364 [Hypholoma sublateritium FD-334 SS-4]
MGEFTGVLTSCSSEEGTTSIPLSHWIEINWNFYQVLPTTRGAQICRSQRVDAQTQACLLGDCCCASHVGDERYAERWTLNCALCTMVWPSQPFLRVVIVFAGPASAVQRLSAHVVRSSCSFCRCDTCVDVHGHSDTIILPLKSRRRRHGCVDINVLPVVVSLRMRCCRCTCIDNNMSVCLLVLLCCSRRTADTTLASTLACCPEHATGRYVCVHITVAFSPCHPAAHDAQLLFILLLRICRRWHTRIEAPFPFAIL